jgi:hypothetical protein
MRGRQDRMLITIENSVAAGPEPVGPLDEGFVLAEKLPHSLVEFADSHD